MRKSTKNKMVYDSEGLPVVSLKTDEEDEELNLNARAIEALKAELTAEEESK